MTVDRGGSGGENDDGGARRAIEAEPGTEPSGAAVVPRDRAIADFRDDPAELYLGGQVGRGTLTRAQAEGVVEAVDRVHRAQAALAASSERLGHRGLEAVWDARDGYTLRFGDDRPGAGRVDALATRDIPPTIVIGEAKGGGAAVLGGRSVDGVFAQQGSATYVNALLRLDSRVDVMLREVVEEGLRARPGSAARGLADAILDRSVRVEFEVFHTNPQGVTRVQRYELDPDIVSIPDIGVPAS